MATTLGGHELADEEMTVLLAFPARGQRLTLSQIHAKTGLCGRDVRRAIDGLLKKGLIVRLHTVIESYSMPAMRGAGATRLRLAPSPADEALAG